MTKESRADRRESHGGESCSFLVRMWREPQAEGVGPTRVYMRNLQTGEELYLGDPKRVGEVLSHEAEAAGRASADDQETDIDAEAQAG